MFNSGDRVMAMWSDKLWYPGTVQSGKGDFLSVQFDDGSQASLSTDQMHALNLNAGSRVEGKFQGGKNWFPGKVTASKGEQVHIQYDDGDQEWTTLRMIRQKPEDVTPGLGVGSRIQGRWKGGSALFPGQITQQKGDSILVQYDDGDQEWTTLAMVQPGK